MTTNEVRLHFAVAIGLILLAISTGIDIYRGFATGANVGDPYVLISARATGAGAVAGTNLDVEYILDRHRYCRTDLDRFIIDAATNEVIWRDRVPGGAGTIGRVTVINKIPIPSNIKLGNYLLRTIIYATCSDRIYDHIFPDVVFKVVK